MADITVSVDRNFEDAAINTLANGDNITIDSGATLTINSDVRWGSQAAVIGNITISSTTGGTCLIDGTTVWWLAFDGGTGTIPAFGSTIQGATSSASGSLLGVFTGYGVAPSSGAMPSTGFIKLRSKTGTFQDNETIRQVVTEDPPTFNNIATVNSSTGGKRGWLHIVGEESSTITVPRLGSLTINGDWFELDTTTSGSRNQTIQLPVSDQYPGVWIETSSSSGVYEFWPNASSQMGTTNYPTAQADIPQRVVYISATGLLRIGADSGGTSAGVLPSSGLKIRIPNVIISSSTSANWNNNLVSATLATRWDLTTTSAGDIDINYVSGAGFYVNCAQAYSVNITNSAFLEQIVFSEIPTAINLNNCHVGLPATNIATVGSPLSITQCFAGGTITDCQFVRPTMASASVVIVVLTDLTGFTFDNVWARSAAAKSANTPIAYSCTRLANCNFVDCIQNDGRLLLTTCKEINVTNLSHYDRLNATTNSTNPVSAIDCTTFTTNVTVDGFAVLGGATNRHPYTGIVATASNCQDITFKTLGTPTSPFNCGSANATGVLFTGGGTGARYRLKRLFADNTRTGSFALATNSDFDVIAESVWGDAADTVTIATNNTVGKGLRGTNTVTGQTAVYGTHFSDYFTSSTAQRLLIHMNEKTAQEPSASSYEIIAGNPRFTSTGSLAMGAANDEIIFEWSYYVKGLTTFDQTTETQPTITGTNPNNHDMYYQIDRNDGSGYGGTWKNLSYKRTGGGGTSGTSTVTMTSTTGVAVNDYVFGTGIGTNARVLSVDSATAVTVSVNNSGTVSGVLVFNQLPNETGLSPTKGTKLKVRIVVNTTSATNLLTYVRIDGVTSLSAQQAVYYPVQPVSITVTALDASDGSPIQSARVLLYNEDTSSVTITRSGSVATVTHTAHGLLEGEKVVIRGADQGDYNGLFEISNVTTNTYDYTVSNSPITPATGTITSQQVVLEGVTDVNGQVTNPEFNYIADLTVDGVSRKGTSGQVYKSAVVSGSLTDEGANLTVFMVRD